MSSQSPEGISDPGGFSNLVPSGGMVDTTRHFHDIATKEQAKCYAECSPKAAWQIAHNMKEIDKCWGQQTACSNTCKTRCNKEAQDWHIEEFKKMRKLIDDTLKPCYEPCALDIWDACKSRVINKYGNIYTLTDQQKTVAAHDMDVTCGSNNDDNDEQCRRTCTGGEMLHWHWWRTADATTIWR